MYTIEFPNLWGIKVTIDPVAFKFGNISVYWYGIIIALGFMLAVLLGMKNSKRFGIESENIIDLVLFAFPAALIFARLYYVVFRWDLYKGNIADIFKTWHGGLAIYGGLIGAFLTAYIFTRIKKMSLLNLLDFASPYIVMAQAIGRWGNFINQEAYGTNTRLPWGMTSERIRDELQILQGRGFDVDPNLPVHPTFLYESLWNIGAFLVLLWFRKRKKLDGEVFFLYVILYGIGRTWIEGLRTDSLMVGDIRVSQLLAVLSALVFAIAFYIRRNRADKSEITDEIGTSEYGAVLKKLNEAEVIPGEDEAEAIQSEDEVEAIKSENKAEAAESNDAAVNGDMKDNIEDKQEVKAETQENTGKMEAEEHGGSDKEKE